MVFALFGLGIIALLAIASGGNSQQKADVAKLRQWLDGYHANRLMPAMLLDEGINLAKKLGLPKTALAIGLRKNLPDDEFLPGTNIRMMNLAPDR